jgi:response regulator RpfG family c-di-GMP phosphodiesterase
MSINKFEEFFEIVKNLSSTLDLDTLLKRIGDAAERITNSEASSIMLVDEDKQHLYFKTATGEKVTAVKKIKIKIGEGIAGSVVLTKESEIVNDVTKDPRFTGKIDQQSGFKTRSILAVPIIINTADNGEEVIGVIEVLNKRESTGFNEEDKKLLESLAGLASVSILNAKFSENQRNFFTNIIELLVSAIETVRPKYIGKYWKMTQMATIVAKMLGLQPHSEEYKSIYFGTLLHDIGYLSPKLKLELENADIIERAKIEQSHVIIGSEIVNKINLLGNTSPIIKHHHENYDGSGYPNGLKGEDIPLGARIVAVVEYVEELKISGIKNEQILQFLDQHKGTRFDPKIVDIVKGILISDTTY